MAKLLYKRVQNTNSHSTGYGKWYLKMVSTETLSFREFIDHVVSHGSTFDRGTVMGVMQQMLDCLVEQLLDSKKVRFGDLGTFYLTFNSDGEADYDKATEQNVKGVRLRFLPSQTKESPLDSRSLRKRASFLLATQLFGSSGTNGSGGSGGSGSTGQP